MVDTSIVQQATVQRHTLMNLQTFKERPLEIWLGLSSRLQVQRAVGYFPPSANLEGGCGDDESVSAQRAWHARTRVPFMCEWEPQICGNEAAEK